MCAERKQLLKAVAVGLTCLIGAAPAFAQNSGASGAGGVALGDSEAGLTDRAYVVAPPNYQYVVEVAPGSFLDCGEGMDTAATDAEGRHMALLTCGVTLTETIVIPTAASSAKLIVHY